MEHQQNPDHESSESRLETTTEISKELIERTTHDVRYDAEEAVRMYRTEQGESELHKRERRIIEGVFSLRIEVHGSSTPLLVPVNAETIIGRRDPTTNVTPEIDLTAYGGYQMGISRRHAIIRLEDRRLDIMDLGSRNGTYLNGYKLPPHEAIALYDGDELRLGKIVLKVFLQQ